MAKPSSKQKRPKAWKVMSRSDRDRWTKEQAELRSIRRKVLGEEAERMTLPSSEPIRLRGDSNLTRTSVHVSHGISDAQRGRHVRGMVLCGQATQWLMNNDPLLRRR